MSEIKNESLNIELISDWNNIEYNDDECVHNIATLAQTEFIEPLISELKSKKILEFETKIESMLSDISSIKDELKTLIELVKTVRKELGDEIKNKKNMDEREKNRYVRSHIPFRFVPDHPLDFGF